MVGVSDHAGWAVLVTATADGTLVDRRRVTLVEDGLPPMPHHHEGQKLPLGEAVALVHRVDASAQRCARQLLDALTEQLDARLVGVALRACPALPPTVAERITDYRSMCVADWVMYRQAIASAARQRRWSSRSRPGTLVSCRTATTRCATCRVPAEIGVRGYCAARAWRRLKRSIRPPVSTSFCLPV